MAVVSRNMELNNKTILVTGSPGVIGDNIVIPLIRDLTIGRIISLDNMNDYYDVDPNSIFAERKPANKKSSPQEGAKGENIKN